MCNSLWCHNYLRVYKQYRANKTWLDLHDTTGKGSNDLSKNSKPELLSDKVHFHFLTTIIHCLG